MSVTPQAPPIERDPPEQIVKTGVLKGYSFDIVTDIITNDPHPVNKH